MFKYQLIDVKQKTDKDVTFGTCQLCMRVSDHTYSVYTFTNVDTGDVIDIQPGIWSWGDFDYPPDVHILDLAKFFNDHTLLVPIDDPNVMWRILHDIDDGDDYYNGTLYQ